MKVYHEQTPEQLTPQLSEYLADYRTQRNFIAANYLAEKACVLNDYVELSGLSSCVVAVSGGVDSAVVLGVVKRAAEQPDSQIRRVVPLLLPVFDKEAATNQAEATSRGEELCNLLGLEPVHIDLTAVHRALKNTVDAAIKISGQAWASGQLVAYTRTPAIYYTTSLLSQSGTPGIVCGTTNLDEGGYLGYFGKASDGMVDVQLISDIHKSEVYKLAEYLGVPESIRQAIPTGDMYDGRIDEEVFGTTYDFVELYTRFLSTNTEGRETVRSGWDAETKLQFDKLAARLEKLHGYNAHKYAAKSPAIHLDILPSRVPQGWQNG